MYLHRSLTNVTLIVKQFPIGCHSFHLSRLLCILLMCYRGHSCSIVKMLWQTVIISLETSIFYSLCSNQVLEDKPDLSRWSLKYKAFGRDIEYSWLARNMQVRDLIYLAPFRPLFAYSIDKFLYEFHFN